MNFWTLAKIGIDIEFRIKKIYHSLMHSSSEYIFIC
jgi:hypothetical protein